MIATTETTVTVKTMIDRCQLVPTDAFVMISIPDLSSNPRALNAVASLVLRRVLKGQQSVGQNPRHGSCLLKKRVKEA